MSVEIRVPEVSDGITAGKVIGISVKVGDRVAAEQTLLELETDKAVVEIPAPVAGSVASIAVSEGETVEIGAVIMTVDADEASGDESPDAEEKASPVAAAEADGAVEKTSAEEADAVTAAQEQTGDADESPSGELRSTPVRDAKVEPEKVELKTADERQGPLPPAAPSVRRLARELGVDIHQVQGNGPRGRISADDVRQFVNQTMQRVTGAGAAVHGEFAGLHAQRPLPDFSRWGEVTRQPLSRVRELTADAMGYAWSTIPMVTQYDQADIGAVEQFRAEYNRRAPQDAALTLTAILAKICAAALKAFPQFNSSLDLAAKELILKQFVHIGVAVDTERGLLVPVVRDVDHKGLAQLAGELNDLAERTRRRKVAPDELEGGGFTISNLGGIGGSSFTPLVYAPQVAILGVSRAVMQPVWNGSEFTPALMLPLSLTYDHRVIDGADGARFLRWICQALEEPLRLLV
ncbi:MAG: 2-oxo acid dehydrogenase subunit E2 [Desulfuromonadales bacterium]|nr:2-oxo acid dehydrogenase subunit E2 [Desulfuromonadales bacterium]